MLEAPELEEKEVEPTAEELEKFREEVKGLFDAEVNKDLLTGHFTSPTDDIESFDPHDLGPKELKLWQGFKACEIGVRPIPECISDFREYQNYMFGQTNAGLAPRGFTSYVGNKLTRLWGNYQLDEKKKHSDN